MRDLWLISDTHFFHKNILSFKDKDGLPIRPEFDNINQMNEYIAERWNSVVKDGDIIYHLGDVFFGEKDEFQQFFNKLNGSKRLIVGNHDNIKYLAKGNFFKKIQMWRMFPEFNLLFTHLPAHPSSLRRGAPDDPTAKVMTNIHGHIHQNLSPEGPYFNVSVEALTDYTPIHIDEVLARTNNVRRSID